MIQARLIAYTVVLVMAVLVSACSASRMFDVSEVATDHPLLQADQTQPHATVYFIRPKTEHVAGYADNVLDVELNGEDLIELARAEYTLLYLKPGDVTVTLRNRTQFRGRWELTEMMRSREFSFEAGETYFIQTRMVDGEFRGVHFIPEDIGLFEAKNATRYLAPAGLAHDYPVSDL